MGCKNQWFTRLLKEFSKSPLGSNVVFGFILMGLEKLVEVEFECPCNPDLNGVFSSAFFIIPPIMAFILMLIIQGCRCDSCMECKKECSQDCCESTFEKCICDPSCKETFSGSSLIPGIVWLVLMFFDGQYLTCAGTDWKGKYVLIDKAGPQKWCEPIGEGNVTRQERMLRSQRLFVVSQGIGLGLLVLICLVLIGYAIKKCCNPEVDNGDADEAGRTGLRTGAGEDTRV